MPPRQIFTCPGLGAGERASGGQELAGVDGQETMFVMSKPVWVVVAPELDQAQEESRVSIVRLARQHVIDYSLGERHLIQINQRQRVVPQNSGRRLGATLHQRTLVPVARIPALTAKMQHLMAQRPALRRVDPAQRARLRKAGFCGFGLAIA